MPIAERPAARRDLAASAENVARGGADVLVRINRPWRQTMLDLEAAIRPRVTALAVTKVDSADHIRLVAEVVSELEAERGMAVGHTKFMAMIETADAWFRMPEIAKASERIVALTLGGEDFALSVGMLPTAEALFMPKQQLAIAARAAGILPMGFIGTVADYKDLDAFRETVRRSRRLGFRGASVIHPAQIPILNEEFAPAAEDVASARKIVAAYDEAVAAGRGSISVDGKMIDVPVVLRAQELLAIHEAIQEREAQSQNEQLSPNTNSSPSAMRRARRGARIISSAAIRMTGRCRWTISSGSRRARSAPSSSTAASPRRPRKKRKRTFLRDPIEALKLVGVDGDTVQDVILTHLHYDHVGGFDRFPKAQFHLQEPEIHYATGRYMRYHRLAHSFEVEDIVGVVRLNFAHRVIFYNGGAELAPGITLHPVGGHSMGLQFVRVHTRRGWVVVASDTTHFYENMMTGRPFTTAFHIGADAGGLRHAARAGADARSTSCPATTRW